MDFEERYYQNFTNPFASLLQIVRTHIRQKQIKTDDDLLALKLELFKTMLKKGHSKKIIRNIANFIKFYMKFDQQEFYSKFEKKLDIISKNRKAMGLMELAIKQRELEIAYEAEKKGIEKAISKEKRNTVSKLLSKNFTVEEIIDIMEYDKKEVLQIQLELQIEQLIVAKKSINQIIEELKVKEKDVLKVIEFLKQED